LTAASEQGATVGDQRGIDTRPHLRLLNAIELVAAGEPVPLPMSAQRVLAFVALHDHVLRRPFVAGSLWLDSPEERASANLRTALWRIHRCGLSLVQASGQQLSLHAAVVVDVRQSEALARRALDGTGPAAAELESSALSGDLLPDWYDDWIVLERERYRQLRLRALEALSERLADAGRFDEALEAGLAAVASEPLRESAHRAVIRVHLADGNLGEALRQYRLCGRLLREQLGIEPSSRMEELMGRGGTHQNGQVRLATDRWTGSRC
jgi:DNA-binding SARP family transcriptional activator